MNKKVIVLSVLTILVVPIVSLAQPATYNKTLVGTAASLATVVLDTLWVAAVAFVIVMFVVAGFKFLTAQGDTTKIAEARKAVIWGAAGTAVVILAWSMTAIIRNQLGV